MPRKHTENDKIVLSFINNQNGIIIYFGDNNSFSKLLKTVLTKYLNCDYSKLIHAQTEKELYENINLLKEYKILLVLDSIQNYSYIGQLLTNLLTKYPDLLCIVVGGETTKNLITLFCEFGAKSFITKPVSIDTLIEKIANVVKPPTELNILINSAKKYLSFGQLELASQETNKIFDLKPDSPIGYIILGDIEMQKQNFDIAINYYSHAHRSSLLYLEPIEKLSDAYLAKNDYENCAKCLNKLDRLSPLNIKRKIEIGKVYLELKDLHLAEKYFNEAIKLIAQEAMDEVVNLIKKIAQIAETIEPNLALKFYCKAMDYKKDGYTRQDIEIFNKLGLIYRRQGKWKEAIIEYEKSLTINKYDEGIYYNIAMAYMEGKQFNLAKQYIEVALRLNPNFGTQNKKLLKNIFKIFKRNEDKQSAQYYAFKVLELDKDDVDIQRFLSANN